MFDLRRFTDITQVQLTGREREIRDSLSIQEASIIVNRTGRGDRRVFSGH